MINVGVIGLGNAGPKKHIPWLELNSKTNLVAVADIDAERVDEISEKHDVAGFTDFEDMLEEAPIESVHVCTPPQTHVDIGTEVLSREIPILLEKPAAMDCEGVEKLKAAAKETDTMASVVHSRLYSVPVREALDRVASGEIGEVVSVDHIYGRDNDLEETHRGDWMYDMVGAGIGEGLPHQIYLPLAFVDGLGKIEGISVRNKSGTEAADFDGVSVQALDESGDAMISIKRLTNTTTQDILHIHGTEGILTIDLVKQAVFVTNTTSGLSAEAFASENVQLLGQLVGNMVSTGLGFARRTVQRKMGDEEAAEQATPHYALIDAFYEAYRAGNDPPISLADEYDSQRVMDAIAETVESKRRATQGQSK